MSIKVLELAIDKIKSAIMSVYLSEALRGLNNDSPFIALGIESSTWNSFAPEWRKEVRRLWRKTMKSRNELLALADKFNEELTFFIKGVSKLKIPSAVEASLNSMELILPSSYYSKGYMQRGIETELATGATLITFYFWGKNSTSLSAYLHANNFAKVLTNSNCGKVTISDGDDFIKVAITVPLPKYSTFGSSFKDIWSSYAKNYKSYKKAKRS